MHITAVILTKNEEKNIERCVKSVSWCDEIIIVDDYSEDETIEKAQRPALKAQNQNLKLKIYKRHLEGNFANQRNFGLEKAISEWVIFIDADEIVNKDLQQEIKKTLQNQTAAEICKGYLIRRRDYIFGKWLKYGETENIKLLRLAKKDTGKWVGKIHEVWEVKGEKRELKNPILHYPHETVTEFLREINWYTDLVAQYWKEEGKEIAAWQIIVYPIGKFIQNYFFRLGFMDGTAGLTSAVFMSFHSFLARSKYWLVTYNE